MDTKKLLQDSLEDYYKGQVAKYKANLSVLLSMHVGLAEHPDIIETVQGGTGVDDGKGLVSIAYRGAQLDASSSGSSVLGRR